MDISAEKYLNKNVFKRILGLWWNIKPKKNIKHFIDKITAINDDKININGKFVWPDTKDEDIISINNI